MTLARSVVSNRADAVRSALARADVNRDGRLSSAEQRRAAGLVSGANDAALVEAFKQARLKSGFVSVSKARGLVSLARSRALAADGNRNGVSATERARLSGPIARALTRGATEPHAGARAPAGRAPRAAEVRPAARAGLGRTPGSRSGGGA